MCLRMPTAEPARVPLGRFQLSCLRLHHLPHAAVADAPAGQPHLPSTSRDKICKGEDLTDVPSQVSEAVWTTNPLTWQTGTQMTCLKARSGVSALKGHGL